MQSIRHGSSTITDTTRLVQLFSLIQCIQHIPKSDDTTLPVTNSSGICHRGWHNKKWVGWHSILKPIDVSQEVWEVQAHSQQLFRATYQTKTVFYCYCAMGELLSRTDLRTIRRNACSCTLYPCSATELILTQFLQAGYILSNEYAFCLCCRGLICRSLILVFSFHLKIKHILNISWKHKKCRALQWLCVMHQQQNSEKSLSALIFMLDIRLLLFWGCIPVSLAW